MSRVECGYGGHVCGNRVQFISRYRNENDYCVDGRRVSIHDDGTVRRAEGSDLERIRLFELGKYAEYIRWREDAKERYGLHQELAPFSFPAVQS